MRLIKQITKTIAVQYDVDWSEYQVTVEGNDNATYHTDDKQDAFDTAKDMAYRKVH